MTGAPTPLAKVEPVTEANERFFVTDTELIQLIGMTPGPAADASASALGLGDHLGNADLRRAGIQSLLVRELAVLTDGDRLEAVGKAQYVGAVLGHATDWLVLSVEGSNVRAFTTLVASPVGNLTIALGPVAVHEVVPLDPALPLSEPLKKLVDAYLADPAINRPLLVRVRRVRGEGDDGVRIEIGEDGAWKMPVSVLRAHAGTEAEVWPHVVAALSAKDA